MRTILLGTLIDRLGEYPDNYFHSVPTDPPYGLKFMGKKWDARVPSVREWEEVARVLRPGGFVGSFGGTRTYHRMVVNMEDAGLEIRDMLSWIYASGFPKSMNLGEGRGTGLKPANEPICLARKPLEGTLIQNLAKYGTGGLNIDACRIPFVSEADKESAIYGTGIDITGGNYNSGTKTAERKIKPNELGRWPANLILDIDTGTILDIQSGVLKSGTAGVIGKSAKGHQGVSYQKDNREAGSEIITYGDEGGASRFFYCAKPTQNERNFGMGEDSNDHPTVKPISLMRYLVRLITPVGGIAVDPFAGSGTTGCACEFEERDYVLIDKEPAHIPIIEKRTRYWSVIAKRERRQEFINQSQLNLF